MKLEDMTREELMAELLQARRMIAELQSEAFSTCRIEDALRESEERYRRITSAITDYIFTVQVRDGIPVKTLHTSVCKMVTGYTPEEFDEDPFLWFNMVVPDDQELVRSYVERILKGEKADRIEHRIMRKDGSIRWVSNAAVLNLDAQGRLISYDGVIRDITGRKRAEEAIKESEQRLQMILHGSPIATLVIDKHHRVISWNEAMEHLTGISAGEMLGTSDHWKAFYMEQRPLMSDIIVDCAEDAIEQWYPDKFHKSELIDEAFEATDFFPSLRGKGKWLRFTAAAIRNSASELIGAIETFEDITERRRVEEDLQKLASVVRYSNELVNLATLDGKMVFLNEAGSEMLGISPEQVDGINILQVIPDHLLDKVRKEVLPALLAGGTWEGELQYRNLKTGRLTEVHAITFAISKAGSGTPMFLANVSLDITEQKHAEEERKKLEAQLIQANKMEALGTLAGGISHDFNNILSAIIAYAERGARAGQEPEKVRKNIEEVLKVCNRARDLVKQILAFSRRTKHELMQIRLDTTVKDSLKMMKAILPKNIDIRQNIQASGRIMADSTQIQQVMMNLCSNAAQAMGDAGGVLEIGLDRVELHDNAEAIALDLLPGRYLRLSIRDSGHGIAPDIMERIFDPYFTTKEKGSGTGLGLSVVHGIAKSHKGAITCSSTPGEGTIFDLYLPEIEPKKEAAPDRAESSEIKGGERILFVDDEPILVKATKERLRYLGYRVVARTGAQEALDLFQKNPDQFDLVITDIIMPGMTGDRLAIELMKIRKDIPVILCTGYSEHINEEKAKELGIRDFIMKPFEIEDLAKIIRKVMDVK